MNHSGLPAHPLRGRAARKGLAGHGARHTGASLRPHAEPHGLGWKAGPSDFLIRVHPMHPWPKWFFNSNERRWEVAPPSPGFLFLPGSEQTARW